MCTLTNNRFVLPPLIALSGFLLTISAMAKTYVIPHILEKSGSILSVNYTFDTTIFATYNGSLNGKDKGSARVDFYLYDEQTGDLMRGLTNTVCGPYSFELNAQNRKVSVRLDDLILNNGGGFDADTKLGFGVIVVDGDNPDAVSLQGFVVNSHTSAFDLSVFGFEPQPIEAAARTTPAGTPQTRRTFVFPHVLETSGRAASSSNAMDTTLCATYTGGLPGAPSGSGAIVDLYLYDQATGEPMVGGNGTAVCNPYTFSLDAATRKRTIVIDDLISAAGGFGGAAEKQGFAVITVRGEDPAGVTLQGFVVNSHTGPFDASILASEVQEVRTNFAGAGRRAFVLPHVLEKSGLVSAESFTLDTTLEATYAGGLGDIPQGEGATLDLYLYDDSGKPLEGLSHIPVCNPCTFGLGTGPEGSASPRKQSIRIDDLITKNGGGFDAGVKLGFGILVVGGSDPDAVNLQGFVVNSHSSAFDLSVFGFEPQPIAAAARTAPGTDPVDPPSKAFVLTHVLETSGKVSSTPFTFDTTIFATYVGGLPGSVSNNGATVKLYLYDSASGLPLSGPLGEVSNPCTFKLSTSERKVSITIDDLIMAYGGGFGSAPTKDAFGVVVLDGDVADVKLQGFVVNAHSGPFDLSVFGFEPQPLASARLRPGHLVATPGTDGLHFDVQTVIGGHYVLESKGNLNDPEWSGFQSFEGDGTVKTVVVPIDLSSPQFFRLKGI